MAKDGSDFTVLRAFTCTTTDGCVPAGALIEGIDGKLYGTTDAGGAANLGTAFSMDKDGNAFTLLRSFDCHDGCFPDPPLIQASDGNLYGTTCCGGLYGSGTIYRMILQNQSQTITVMQNAPPSAPYNTLFNVAATGGGSGNPVMIAGSGACSGGGNNSATITMTSGTGTCTVTFNQAGGGGFDPAPQVTQTTTAQVLSPTISINNIPVGAVNGGSFTPTFAYAGDGIISVTSSTQSRCTVSGSVVNFVGGGTCTLTAAATATANSNAATGSPQSFTISPAPTTISITNIPGSAAFGGSFTPTLAYNGNGKTSVTSSTLSKCTVAKNGVVSFVGVGTCTLTANATATQDYLAATGDPQSFSIGQATTTISIKNLPKNAKRGGSFTPTYNYTGDGTTSTTSSTPTICIVAGNVVNFSSTNSGTCTLRAQATAGTNYGPAIGNPQSFTVR
jgi:uncharacterized repeat protein (TIGR03803 family)